MAMRAYATLREMKKGGSSLSADQEELIAALEEMAGVSATRDDTQRAMRAMAAMIQQPTFDD